MSTDPSENLPRQWGRYRLTDVLGRGGMGVVYGGELEGRGGFAKPVAVKVLQGGHTDAFLLEEARLGGYLHHPYIVETYDVGVHEGQVYAAMEWVRGPTLHEVLVARTEPLDLPTALDIVQQLCLALSHAHALSVRGQPVGLVHLDVKPRNLLLDPLGFTKLADFGIARAAGFRTHDDTDGLPGTIGYMAPEGMTGLPVDARADVFAAGTMLAELVLGRRLWTRKGGWLGYGRAVTKARRTLTDDGVPEALDAVLSGLGELVLSATQAHPDRRLPSAQALHDAVRELNPGGGSIAGVVSEHLGTSIPKGVDTGARSTGSRLPHTNLVDAEDRFFGREAELQAVQEALQGKRLITLHGAGGTGKTRLARSVGLDALERFAGGVWFIDLSSSAHLEDMLSAVRTTLRLAPAGGEVDQRAEALGERLGERGRTLLILDNFEQLVDSSAPTIRRWLEQAPELSLLVTSQRRLGLPREQLVPVPGLPLESAVALFRERASAIGATLGDTHEGAIRQIVQLVDGLPLAVELAAARARMIPPDEIARAMEQRLRLLVDRSGSRPDRHRTLRNAIDWSWQLLSGWQQAALAQLSVFRGGFSVDAAQAVLDLMPWPDAPWPLFVLEDLLDRALLVVEPGPEPRFRLLLGVRDFAEERLREPGAIRDPSGASVTGPVWAREVEARHGGLFARFGRMEAVKARYGPDAARHIADLLACVPDIAVAVERAIERGDADVASGAANAATAAAYVEGPSEHIPPMLERVLALDVPPGPRGNLQLGLHYALRRLGRAKEAREANLEALEAARARGDDRWIGIFLGTRAQQMLDEGLQVEAIQHYEQAIVHAEASDDVTNGSVYRLNLAMAHMHRGALRDALERLAQVEKTARQRGFLPLLNNALLQQAVVLFQLGRVERAGALFEAAEAAHRELGALEHLCISMAWLARLSVLRGDLATAEDWAGQAVQLAQQRLGDQMRAGMWAELSRVLTHSKPERALDAALRAVRLFEEADLPVRSLHTALAEATLAAGQPAQAVRIAERAVRSVAMESLVKQVEAWLVLGRARVAVGEPEAARTALDQALERIRSMGIPAEGPLAREAAELGERLP